MAHCGERLCRANTAAAAGKTCVSGALGGGGAAGDIIRLTDAENLRPFVLTITGPLIRIVNDRFTWEVKAAIIETLGYVFRGGRGVCAGPLCTPLHRRPLLACPRLPTHPPHPPTPPPLHSPPCSASCASTRPPTHPLPPPCTHPPAASRAHSWGTPLSLHCCRQCPP